MPTRQAEFSRNLRKNSWKLGKLALQIIDKAVIFYSVFYIPKKKIFDRYD